MGADKTINYIDGERSTYITFSPKSDTVFIESKMDDEEVVSLFLTKNEIMYAISFFQAEMKSDRLRDNLRVSIA